MTDTKPTLGAITIGAQMLKDLFIDSARYACGRFTAHARCVADDILRIIHRNRGKFSEDWLAFYASDIRENISDEINGRPNIHISQAYNGTNRYDAYTLIAQWLEHNPNCRCDHYDFIVNCRTGDVKATKRDIPLPYSGIDSLRADRLEPWVRLANYLDRSKWRKVTVRFNGADKEFVCVPGILSAPIYDKEERHNVGMRYTAIFHDIDKLPSPAWIAPEYITDIKTLEEN